jgi:hypothetical protein
MQGTEMCVWVLGSLHRHTPGNDRLVWRFGSVVGLHRCLRAQRSTEPFELQYQAVVAGEQAPAILSRVEQLLGGGRIPCDPVTSLGWAGVAPAPGSCVF